MNPIVKKRWISALRDEERFPRGRAKLHRVVGRHRGVQNEHQFCPLGVLCELAIEDGVEIERIKAYGGWSEDRAGQIFRYMDKTDRSFEECYPPSQVRRWANIRMEECIRIASMNDKGMSTEMLVHHIEREF